MKNNKHKFAFTLAEVLVTLGIIGVVAVLTVPNIISNYQKKVYVAQLQKAYSQLQQVFALAMADDEVEYISDTELIQSIKGIAIYEENDQTAFSSKLGQYMKIEKVCQPMDFSEGCHDIYYFDFYENGTYIDEENGYSKSGSNRGGDLQVFTKDGMIYYFSFHLDKYFEESTNILTYNALIVDVNGRKSPNKFGRDVFKFSLLSKGELVPQGSVIVEGEDYNWETDYRFCKGNDTYGFGCAARIIDSGWVMDY